LAQLVVFATVGPETRGWDEGGNRKGEEVEMESDCRPFGLALQKILVLITTRAFHLTSLTSLSSRKFFNLLSLAALGSL
jgi:hypothetical protein